MDDVDLKSQQAPVPDDVSLLFLVTPAIHPTVLSRTLASIGAQGIRGWRCVVLEESFTDEVSAVVAEITSGTGHFTVLPVTKSVVATVDGVVRDAEERFCVVVTPGDLLAVDYASRMMGAMRHGPEITVVSCDVLGPEGIRSGQDAGLMTLESYLACPVPSTATMISTSALRDTIGSVDDLKYQGEFGRALSLLRSDAWWLHVDEPLVVSSLRAERVACRVGEARAFAHEADSAVWGALAALPIGRKTTRRLMRAWSHPEFAESMRSKRRLWSRLASHGYRGALRDMWHHLGYFSPRMRPVVLVVAMLPGILRRPLAQKAYTRIENL
ncbi:MAG: hypothetical protein JXP37_09765 [Coriobacteriia bacterium]|nr:hypothetical protein [Coriobacteriia bacterium]